MRKRVAVTGIGTVCSAGEDAAAFTASLKQGRRCFSRLEDSRLSNLTATHAGLVPDLIPNAEDPVEVRVLDRNVHLALNALREATNSAGLDTSEIGPRGAVVFGTCSGGMLSIEKHYEGLARGVDILDEDLLFSKRYYTTAKILAWAVGASGPALTVVTACAAGAGAVAQGMDLIRAGLADVVLAGGSDTFAPSTLVGFDALKATCEGVCAPFSKTIGLNLGEGAAFFVLEDLERAARRNTPILAELLGSGLSNDAYHPTAPDPSTKGQVAAMDRALRDAGTTPNCICYINAHGTGTRANDPAESRAIVRLLGDHAEEVPVSSTKSMVGHCLGAAGALETAATILGARSGFVPPTAGFEGSRDGCNLADYVNETGRPWRGRIALTNSFGFAGNNACLLMDVNPRSSAPVTELPKQRATHPVVTGIGIVSPCGFGLDKLVNDSASAIGEIDRFPVPARPFLAGLVPPIESREVDRRLDIRGMDLCSKYTTLAARDALTHAGLKPRPKEMARVGMVLGIATGPSQGESDHLGAVFKSDFRIDSLGAFPYVVPNEVTGHVARVLMLKGHNTVLATGRGAGLTALISAAMAVEQGHGDLLLAAAADELTERSISDGHRMRILGPETGVTPGEGAAVLTVEDSHVAAARDATVLGEIIGYGLTTSIQHPRRGGEDALVRALTIALERAGLRPGDIQLLTTSSGGGPVHAQEQRAFAEIFKGREVRHFTLADRLGIADAALPIFDLAYLLATTAPGTIIASTSLSPEGFASALLICVGPSPRTA